MKDAERLSPYVNREGFFDSLRRLQVPCPWGDLQKGEGIEELVKGKPGLFSRIPNIPLGLVVGCGHQRTEAYEAVAYTRSFTKMVYSDILSPYIMPTKDYVVLDLEDPDSVNLFGFKVHAIMSIGVFTYDTHGVRFPNREVERRTAKALSDLLMPGGIIANDNLVSVNDIFERILVEELGFRLVKEGWGTFMLQKTQS